MNHAHPSFGERDERSKAAQIPIRSPSSVSIFAYRASEFYGHCSGLSLNGMSGVSISAFSTSPCVIESAHITVYRYDDLIPLCHNLVHLQPRDTIRQSCQECSLTVLPHPAARQDRVDFFGNHVTWLSIQEPHNRLRFDASSEVEVTPFIKPADMRWPAWEDVVEQLKRRLEPDFLDARQFTYDSPFIPRDDALAEYARPTFSPGRPVWDAVEELSNRIFTEFKFDSKVTTIGTPVLEVLAHKHGVCQDFAHLMIGCLRTLGLAARYVSGYLVTRPPPGKPRLVGCDVSHAWVSVFFPDLGWADFDPTNGIIPSAEHITVAWARDYEDLSPVRGVIVGGRGHTLSVSVDVAPIVEPEPATA